MKNESKFWQEVAGAINPGWSIRANPLANGSSGRLAGNDAFIYIVDVASGWLGAGAIMTSDAPKILASCRAFLADQSNILTIGSIRAADVAGRAIALCGAARAEPSAPEVSTAISMTAAALQETLTFECAVQANRQQGLADMAGHWIYLAYRTKNSTRLITRPLWVSSVHPGIGRSGRFLDPGDLMGIVRTVVRSETTSTQSATGKGLAAEGGAIVSPILRALA